MSDDFHRPTLTFPAGTYNATQVRLYGIAPDGGFVYPGHPRRVDGKDIRVSIETISNDTSHNGAFEATIKKERKDRNLSDSELFATMLGILPILPPLPPIPIPPIPHGFASQLSVDLKSLGNLVISTAVSFFESAPPKSTRKPSSCGIMVGYSYEGHCYDFSKPKIMIVPALPQTIPADDCGYERKKDSRYQLWIVDKLDECVEFEMNQGFVEQIVLDANLPGKRSPTMYASRMMMGHRSGRLNES